jgi:hypothetical protein
MRTRVRDESGVALVVSILISGLMLGMALALLGFADGQASQTGRERISESTLTLAEAAMNAQANLLSAAWPETPDLAFAPCTQASSSIKCPDPGSLLRGFGGSDFGTNGSAAAWSITIRDNGTGAYYDDTATASQPAWDASGPNGVPDDTVWMRAEATLKGQRRTLVTLVRANPIAQTFPRGVITAGHFHTTNNGNKVIVDTGSGPGILARCAPASGGPSRGDTCLDYPVDKGQVWPNLWSADVNLPNALPMSEVNSLRNRAKAAGTWFNTCPGTLPSAPLVFIESGSCAYSATAQYNSAASPGLLVLYSGTLTLAGSSTFYGLIYSPNANSLTGNVVALSGSTQVVGAIVVDKQGGISAGSSKVNLLYDANVFNLVTTTQSINVIANSWRELNKR